MRFLTVGGGGREHAAVEALHRSDVKIFAVMKNANPGIISRAANHLIASETDIEAVCAFAKKMGVQYAFIGPEAPLEAGLVDALESQGVSCAAPTAKAARIESSKVFMRELVNKYGIEGNLAYASFTDATSAIAYLENASYEIVIKPVGLTGGKGVKVQGEHLHSKADAVEYINEIFDKNIGGAGVIIEEKAVGEEFTLMVFCDGKKISPMPLVQDHKRAYEGDTGPNTGGMGSYSDADHLLPFVTVEDKKDALRILGSIVNAMAKEGCPYKGPMYGQFMLTVDGPKIIEINARFGDPEAMNVLPLLKSDFADICKRMAKGNLGDDAEFAYNATVCKYVVPEGYGVESVSGKEITVDVNAIRNCGAEVFFANVNESNGRLYTGTSRAIGVVGISNTIESAEKNCEAALRNVKCDHCFVRHDIGKRDLVLKRVEYMKQLRSANE